MKLSFSTLPFMKLSASELHELCRRHAMKAEIRCNPDDTFPYEAGLPVSNLGSGICLRGYDNVQLCRAEALLDRAAACSIDGVRIFLGNFCVRRDASRAPLEHNGIVSALKRLCERGVGIWIETHNEYATSEMLLPLLQEVNSPLLGIIWDIAHPLEDGENAETTWNHLSPYIKQIHIKDAKPHPDMAFHDWYYTKLGEGELPIGKVLSMTQKDGYEGCYSLEWEDAWRAELKGVYTNADKLLSDYRAFMESL